MKIALIADIHSNAKALSAVLNSASDAKADILMIAGDLVGYYFEPAETLGLLLEWQGPIYAVRGNHEEMLLSAKQSHEARKIVFSAYGPGVDIAIEQLSDSQLDWISNLPHPLLVNEFNSTILLCHGSPRDINYYVYPDTPLDYIFAEVSPRPSVLVMGHTHYPMIKREQECLIINPGSVGQPRNRQPGAHWVLLDTETLAAVHQIAPYNIGRLVDQCNSYAPNHPYLKQVLTRT